MLNKDPGKMHFYVSIIKSGLRIVGCGAVLAGVSMPLVWLAGSFLAAEVLGIVEEL